VLLKCEIDYPIPQVTSRLDFIWKEQAERELTNMKSNRALNDTLIKVRDLA